MTLTADTHPSIFEQEAAASALVRDVRAVLDTAGPNPAAFSILADRAAFHLAVALREAAGRPLDARWSGAYDALNAFVAWYHRYAHGTCDRIALKRLSDFLAENDDLVAVRPVAGAESVPPYLRRRTRL